MADPDILAHRIQQCSVLFDEQCNKRHEAGAAEYGPVEFLKRNTLEMAMEEVIDLANYARYTFIKLALLNEDLSFEVANGGNPEIGVQSFKTTRFGE